MKLWDFMGGRRNTMGWAAFIVACVCLFTKMNGQPIATFVPWGAFVVTILSVIAAGIVTEEKFQKTKDVEMAKVASTAEVAKVEGQAEVDRVEATK